MHHLPTLERRNKLKTNNLPTYSTRPRSLSALSLIQPSQLHARATSVVRKVIGTRLPLKEADLFIPPAERHSCDKPRSSADSTRPEVTRPRSNTTPTESTWPKDITATSPHHERVSAHPDTTGPTQELHLPVDSLLFSPTPDTPPLEDQQEMEASPARTRSVITSSPEMYDSGYASGQSSAAGSAFPMSNASPIMPKTPRTAARPGASPLTPGAMNMRLSPSVPRSMMPMPILNLPALPAAPAPDHTLPRTRSLQPGEMRHVKKSMPALMRHGTSNMPTAHHEEDDDDDGDDGSSGSDSDSSETEDTLATGDSSPEARESIDSIQESAEHSSSEDADYFDAREAHTPATEQPPHVVSGPDTPRASEQNRNLPEASALGLQITPGPSAISGSPWTLVDTTPGADRYTNGHTSRMDYFSHPVTTARQILKSPRRTPRIAQLATLASPSKLNVTTPRANPAPLSPIDTIARRRARAATVLRDVGESSRPALYQQVSQSMMNLSSPTTEGMSLGGFDALRSPLRTPRDGLPTIAATPGSPPPMLTPLMRRNSMPTLIRHPPEYKELYPSIPREEEGKEKLPPYSCGIHIEAMMPRKMEFTAPGVLAKDRGWKKQYIVLHGTSLFVYKNDIRKVPIGGKVKGKEKYEGVVTEDEVDLNLPTVHLPGHESAAPRPPLTTTPRRASRNSSNGTSESGNSSRSSLLSRFHGNSSRSTIPPQQESAPFDDKGSASQSTASINTNSSSSTSKRWSHNQAAGSFASSLPHFNPPFSSGNALVRHYTLQKSESGLGSDYYKRRNVIRVRCEGEQFLLQAENVMQVVDWIEALQAGTNVALDLDERPMTKPPPFPRRRRRRRVRPADSTEITQPATPGATTSINNTNQ